VPPVSTTGGNGTQQVVQHLAVSDLAFDPDNPRLPTTVDGRDEEQVFAWMLVDESLAELIGSIGAQGYFPGEPVLVAPNPETGPRFVVVEGNRRLAAVKLLAEPGRAPVRQQTVERLVEEADFRPTALPVIVFDSRDDILDYLGYRHVTGVKEWEPLAKARYLEQLLRRAQARGETLSDQQLARRIGSRADYVRLLRKGLEVYDHVAEHDFYGIEGVDEDAISFSVLTTALSYENIAGFVGTDDDPETGEEPDELRDDNLRDVVEWMFRKQGDGKTVLGESRNLGQLAAVVKSPEARVALKQGLALADAVLLTDEPLQSFRKAVRQAGDKLKLARTMTHRIGKVEEADLTMLTELFNLARELAGVIRNKLDDDREPTL
jgi:hypothetical protein